MGPEISPPMETAALPQSIAFFDFDRTLISENSATLWVKHEVRSGAMSLWAAARAAYWIAGYQLGLADLNTPILKSVAMLAGQEEHHLKTKVTAWYEDELSGLYRPRARPTIQMHRQRGDLLVLLSTTSGYAAELICDDLGLDAHLSNSFVVDDTGVFTGEANLPLCFGEGKLEHAKRFAGARGLALADCWFYTDSISDLPVLEAVGYPMVVHPDAKLKRLAASRGWPVADWGR